MPRWIHRLLHHDAVDKQLDAELQFHLEQQIGANLDAGMSPEEARRRAQIALGGVEQVKQKTRDVHWENSLENIWKDLRFAVRSLSKDRKVALTAIFTLAVGIGAATVAFSVFYNLVFNAFAAKNAGRLAFPQIKVSGVEVFPLTRSFATFTAIRKQNRTFEDMVAYFHKAALLRDGSQTRQHRVAYVTPNAFEFYGVPAALGRGIKPEDGKPGEPPVFVISYQSWIVDFNADPAILGKTFALDGELRTLVGVMPPRFHAFGAEEVDLWIPIKPDSPSALALRPDIYLMGRLKTGVSINAAGADLDLILHRLAVDQPDDFPKRFTIDVQSATDYLLGPWGIGPSDDSAFDFKRMLYSLLGAGILLLLIACANVSNLLLARATVREKEIAVRAALGATRARLTQQLLMESLMLAIAACGAGCVLASFGMKGVSFLLPHKGGIGDEAVIGLSGRVLLFALCVTFFTTLICGVAPLFHALRRDVQLQLGGSARNIGAGFRHGRLRSALAISEIVLSVVLFIGAGLLLRSFVHITHVDLGFNPDNLVLAAFGNPERGQSKSLVQEAMQRLKELPGVTGVAINNSIPGYNGGAETEIVSPSTHNAERSKLVSCSEAALRTLEMRLARGRWFSQADISAARPVAVVNKTLARRFFAQQNPVGQHLEVKHFGDEPAAANSHFYEIIGVVDDVKNDGPLRAVIPQIFIPSSGSGILFIRTKGNPDSMMRAIQRQIWGIDSNIIFEDFYSSSGEVDVATYSAPRFGFVALASLASLGVLLAFVGVFSVMAYTVSLQMHDIGIRLALGAGRGDILRMVLGKGLGLIGIGIVIGVAASLGLTRFIASQLWGVSPTDPWTFAAVVVCILGVGLAACFFPARRATQVDPAITLRYE